MPKNVTIYEVPNRSRVIEKIYVPQNYCTSCGAPITKRSQTACKYCGAFVFCPYEVYFKPFNSED